MTDAVKRGDTSSLTGPAVAGVHAIDTGRLLANRTFLRGEGLASLLRPVELYEFPALAFVLEHPEGTIVIDTGMGEHITKPKQFRGFPPEPLEAHEIGPQLLQRGIDPAGVRTVVLTHLDWDHVGGVHHFPGVEVLVHRPEYEATQSRMGRMRYRPEFWPRDFRPTLYDLDPEPYGPFPASRAITGSGDVRLVPVPGHAPGQVAVAFDAGAVTILFAADHMLRADWFVEDLAAGRHVMLGAFGQKAARTTSRRLEELVRTQPTVLLPAHDAEAPGRLARREVTTPAGAPPRAGG